MRCFTLISLSFCILTSATGCVGQIEPDDEALLADELDEDATLEEPIGESSEAVTSCAVKLVCAGGHQLTLYEHSDCSGGRLYLCPGNYDDLRDYNQGLGWFANWNDRASILFTSSNVYAYVYSDVGFKGDVKYIGPNQWKNLGGTIWNDQVSSIKVRAR